PLEQRSSPTPSPYPTLFRSFAGGNGAYGLSETLGALQQGQVAHLLLGADGQWRGNVAPNGMLAPENEVPPGTDPESLVPEPYLRSEEHTSELQSRENLVCRL